jgi:hypothetical protein
MSVVALGLQWSSSFADDNIGIGISVENPAPEDAVYLNQGAGVRKLSDHLANNLSVVPVPVGDVAMQPAKIYVKWSSGSMSSSIPVYLLPSFAGQEVDIFFTKPDVTEQNYRPLLEANCNGADPDSLAAAFQIMSICSAIVRVLINQDAHNEWTKPYNRAVNGWFKANYYLYTLPQQNVKVTYYGMQPEVVDILQQMADLIDGGKPPGYYNPIREQDVRRALLEVKNENIRLAGLAPTLKKLGYLDAARVLNQKATEAYDAVVDPTSNKKLFGVNRNVLMDNAAYFRTIHKT